jgi:hypothetical protein
MTTAAVANAAIAISTPPLTKTYAARPARIGPVQWGATRPVSAATKRIPAHVSSLRDYFSAGDRTAPAGFRAPAHDLIGMRVRVALGGACFTHIRTWATDSDAEKRVAGQERRARRADIGAVPTQADAVDHSSRLLRLNAVVRATCRDLDAVEALGDASFREWSLGDSHQMVLSQERFQLASACSRSIDVPLNWKVKVCPNPSCRKAELAALARERVDFPLRCQVHPE